MAQKGSVLFIPTAYDTPYQFYALTMNSGQANANDFAKW